MGPIYFIKYITTSRTSTKFFLKLRSQLLLLFDGRFAAVIPSCRVATTISILFKLMNLSVIMMNLCTTTLPQRAICTLGTCIYPTCTYPITYLLHYRWWPSLQNTAHRWFYSCYSVLLDIWMPWSSSKKRCYPSVIYFASYIRQSSIFCW